MFRFRLNPNPDPKTITNKNLTTIQKAFTNPYAKDYYCMNKWN